MTNKKRLEEIKLKFNNTIDTMLYVPYEDVKFLIEQAYLEKNKIYHERQINGY